MYQLELRVPPLAVLLIFGMLMYGVSQLTPRFNVEIDSSWLLFLVIFLVFLSIAIIFLSALTFYRVGTTVNPLRPDLASSLVVCGIYQYSRNPIYLSLTLILLSWGIYLSNILSLVFIVLFVQYINRFQIEPEERALSKLFGEQFVQYQSQVRRWF